jgi:hypothetical protein
MKFCSLLLMLWGSLFSLHGQSLHPGGVPGAVQWYSTDTAAAIPGLRSRMAGNNNLLTVEGASVGSLNYHPSLVLAGSTPLRINLGLRDWRSASYFTVYQSLDTAKENSIWHMTSHEQTTLMLTTDRMADLGVYQYMNYTDVVRDQPKVHVYVQHKEKDSLSLYPQWWHIGVKPVRPQLPVTNLKGLIPEIIAYDRVLNSRERLQVASYLALKYGITLTEPGATYLNSAGEKIWDGYDYSAWHRNIAGIARDDAAGLHQTMATSSNSPGLLTITAKDTLTNNSFVLWGDNGMPLTIAFKTAGLPLLLQRTWLMKTYGNQRPFTTDLVIDTRAVDAALPVKPVYWLVIDATGEGRFNALTAVFIKMDKLDRQGKASFNNITWDKDGSGKDVWAIMAARELLLATAIDQPTCTAASRTGSLQVRILGGQAPYQLRVQNKAGVLISRHIDDAASPIGFDNLPAGKYFLAVTDAAQHIYTDSLYINNADAPAPAAIADSYALPAGSYLRLNAASDMPDGLAWEWSGPGNFRSFNPQVTITAPGLYTLRCSKNGCSHVQDVVVTAAPNNILYNITVYPNPTPAAFNARITLDEPAPVTMQLYAPDGKLVSTQKGKGRANYLFTGELKTAGTYELVFTSGLSKTSKRLVIVK